MVKMSGTSLTLLSEMAVSDDDNFFSWITGLQVNSISNATTDRPLKKRTTKCNQILESICPSFSQIETIEQGSQLSHSSFNN